MHIIDQFWTKVIYFLNWLTLSPDTGHRGFQSPLGGDSSSPTFHELDSSPLANGPVFTPPSAPVGSRFTCDYSSMIGWHACSSSDNRGCWLKNSNGQQYNINTDYETNGPIGITRKYRLVLTDTAINADGIVFPYAKVFNNSFPGPWLQACWGDRLNITVVNYLRYNGTSVHWHGIRQLLSNPSDGVNGVTQCAIAPGDQYTYVWNATQYGSTWYHSHYSSQYADGVQGPITIHGPTSAPFDEAKDPLIMTDWGHNSAFAAAYQRFGLDLPSILLNGTGNITRYSGTKNTSPIPQPYQMFFQPKSSTGLGRAKRYLLRLINTSFDATFIFTIDNHLLEVTTSDFVPIRPYNTTSVLIGIGQRYNVIVYADPQGTVPSDGNFWIRTYEADGCGIEGSDKITNYERAGILRYNPSSRVTPTTSPWRGIQHKCSDEPYQSLIPVVPWQVGPPNNGREQFNVQLGFPPGQGIPGFPLALFSFQEGSSNSPFQFVPMHINYSDPSIMHLVQQPNVMPPNWVVVPENYQSTSWIYLFIADNPRASITFGPPHPIHLHGHDFAVLQQSEAPFTPGAVNLKLNNPPRRDVALLPSAGFLVLAFRTDNPGNWLLHCHIARHAAGGLGLQILERQADAYHLFGTPATPAWPGMNRVCSNWKNWFKNCNNFWGGCNVPFQGDSGI